jgi:tRNA pseudouridine13 synthase
MNEAQVGDIVCFKNEIGFPDVRRTQRVKHDNIKGIDNLIKRGRAFVTAPIVGYETVLSNGAQGEIEREILDELDINPDDFRIPQMEEINSRGLRRVIMLRSRPKLDQSTKGGSERPGGTRSTVGTRPKYEIGLDELNLGKSKVKMEFTLPKGSYATVVLREFMKIKK